MSSENNNGFRKIVPISNDSQRSKQNSGNKLLTFQVDTKAFIITTSLIFLSIVLIMVFFFLPNWVGNNNNNDVARTNTTTEISPSNNNPSEKRSISDEGKTESSPWDKAQDTKTRKDTQQVLQEMLEAQKTLERNQVIEWAKNEYEASLAIAKKADSFYNQQKFTEAKSQYTTALDNFNLLIAKIDTLYKTNIEIGFEALNNGNQTAAINAFKTALLFEKQTGEASKGLERSKKLEQVFANIQSGDDQFNNANYKQAKIFYEAALDIDPETNLAKDKLSETNTVINNIQFRNFMTAGFNALEQKKYQSARNAFKQALKLKPNAVEATSALQQTNVQSTNNQINITLESAAQAQTNEDWETAITYYKDALKQDSNLSIAINGLRKAETQLAIHQKITAIISQPNRLNDPSVFNEVKNFYQDLTQLQSPGPVFTSQLKKLEKQLAISATPINIRLLSDNQTEVTVYKVGKMGAFESKQISLRPGKYTAVGIRPGYRDVRVEFLVSADKNDPVIIRTSEKIY